MLRPGKATLFFDRKMSFLNMFKNWSSTCEKVDCTKPTEPAPKYIIEKSCCKSIFESWKPKIPELKSNPIRVQLMRQFTPPKVCIPGMKVPPKSRCEIEAEAKECEARNHPMWIKHCPKKTKNQVDGPLPPLRAALVECKLNKGKIDKKQPKSMRTKCTPQIPEPDWNHDGFMS